MTNLEKATQAIAEAQQAIVDEMFKNGPEEGCKRWEDYSDPLQQAIQSLLGAKLLLHSKKAMAMLEHHRSQEESATQGL